VGGRRLPERKKMTETIIRIAIPVFVVAVVAMAVPVIRSWKA